MCYIPSESFPKRGRPALGSGDPFGLAWLPTTWRETDDLQQLADVATHVIPSARAVPASAIAQLLSQRHLAGRSVPTDALRRRQHVHYDREWRAQEWVPSHCAPSALALTYRSIRSRGVAKVWISGRKRDQECFESESKEDYAQDQTACSTPVDSRQLEGERHDQYVQQRNMHTAGNTPVI
jgi:hypothetical protein